MNAIKTSALLVRQTLAGDPRPFADLVQRHDERVRQVVAASISDAGALEDVVQQVFYLAFKNLAALEDPERFEPWLLTIARRCAVDHFRRSRKPPTTCLEDVDPVSDEAQAWIWEEIHMLPAPHGQILHLRYREGLSYQEIAEELHVPLSTVRGRIYQARKLLRSRLKNHDA